jgi:hypothetical protein
MQRKLKFFINQLAIAKSERTDSVQGGGQTSEKNFTTPASSEAELTIQGLAG